MHDCELACMQSNSDDREQEVEIQGARSCLPKPDDSMYHSAQS